MILTPVRRLLVHPLPGYWASHSDAARPNPVRLGYTSTVARDDNNLRPAVVFDPVDVEAGKCR